MSDFVHLHCHTEYSLLDGAIRLKDLCARAKEYGMPAAAVTDHGNMYAAAYFSKFCDAEGIKPIFGCEVYTCHDHFDKTSPLARKRNHLVLLAQNETGYHNLVKLVTKGFMEGLYYKPRVDKKLLAQYNEGIIALSACIAGEIPKMLLHGTMDEAMALTREYMSIFPDRFYLELQSNGLQEQEILNAKLLDLADRTGLPLVATNDCHYLNASDVEAHDVLLCIQTQTTIDNPKRMRFETRELYYKSPEEMEKAFAHVPQAITNTAKIADMCNVKLDFGNHYFPKYTLPEGMTVETEFVKLARDGLERRIENHPDREHLDVQQYRDRLEYELKVILEMGFPGYFLIVQDFINWAKDNSIPVGPGRGSAAGSLVAWALRITNLDPIPYNLLFERFLNIERVSLPDIDVDFCERRRHLVIQYMVEKYGADSVAQITTFGTMKAKGVVRDVGRALGFSVTEADRIAKLVPDDLKMTLKKAMEQEPRLADLYKNDPRVHHLIDICQRLEGLTRHASIHAAGLVVSPTAMDNFLPLYRGKNGEIVTQFDGPMTEQTGLVKFDFLGLKTMTLIQDTLDNIEQEGKIPPNLDNLSLNDKETYELFGRGDTDGVFQVESSGMRDYLRKLRPTCFEDIIAMLALYRPGPLGSGMVDEFIKRKHGLLSVTYPVPTLENCLKDTYGVIVYQEQVMQIAQIVANYTLGGADLLRRAMGKKKAEAMAAQREKFVAGAAENNIPEEKANEIFDLMEQFAAYGFNKSHSAAYALVSYFTAYFKVHYKVEFMAALLSSEMGNQDKVLKYIACCRDMGIDVVQPSVNESLRSFTARKGRVVYGLGGIKNVGSEAINGIVEARKDGPYTSLLDLVCRVSQQKMNKKVLECLIKGGACDCFNAPRAAMLATLETVFAKAQKKNKEENSKQVSLLSMTKPAEAEPQSGIGFDCPENSMPEMSDEDKLKSEKEVLGFFLTSHPLQPFRTEIRRLGLTTLEETKEKYKGAEVHCALLVTSLKIIINKKGERMAFAEVEDLTGHAEMTIFSRTFAASEDLLTQEKPIYVEARLESSETRDASDDDNPEENEQSFKLLAESIAPLEEVCRNSDAPIIIEIPAERCTEFHLRNLRAVLESFPGNNNVILHVVLDGQICILNVSSKICIKPGPELDKALVQWARTE